MGGVPTAGASAGLPVRSAPVFAVLRAAAALVVLLAVGCDPAARSTGPGADAAEEAPIGVMVTVPPQAYLVERIGGERVSVEVLMPPGSSGETFAPTPRQRVALARADVYVLVGHPAFPVEQRHVLPALERNPDVQVVDMSAGMGMGVANPGLRVGEELASPRADTRPAPTRSGNGPRRNGQIQDDRDDDHGHGHHGGAGDPHVWTSPRLMRSAAVTVAAALAELDPEGAPAYRARLDSLLAEIDALDAEIRRELAGLARRRFLVVHPAWGHFAADYGLEQVAIEHEGKMPGPRGLVKLVEAARAEGIPVVFAQRGFPRAPAEAVAAEIGARVVVLDPLARSWLDETRATARAIAAALGAPAPATSARASEDP